MCTVPQGRKAPNDNGVFLLYNSVVMKLKDLEALYKKKQEERKAKIRAIPNKFKRFWCWVWYFMTFAFVWLFYNIRDWHSGVCVFISLMLWSSSVWIWYALAIFTGVTTDTAKWFAGIGTAVWIWWASPLGSPFILLVTITAIGMKALWDILRSKKGKKMKKIFISQPMLNHTNDEIKEKREILVNKLKKKYKKIEVIDSFFEDAPHDSKPLWYLSKSLELMSTADVVVFAEGWDLARGCKIEHECAKQYNYEIIYEKDLKK